MLKVNYNRFKIAAIDQANTNLLLDCKVYRVKAGTCASFNVYKNVIDLYRTGF